MWASDTAVHSQVEPSAFALTAAFLLISHRRSSKAELRTILSRGCRVVHQVRSERGDIGNFTRCHIDLEAVCYFSSCYDNLANGLILFPGGSFGPYSRVSATRGVCQRASVIEEYEYGNGVAIMRELVHGMS